MKYRIREGILLRKVCDVWLLIAVGDAVNHCKYVCEINESLAYYWQLLEQGLTTDAIVDKAASDYDAPKSQIEKDVKTLVNQLCNMGYIIEETA